MSAELLFSPFTFCELEFRSVTRIWIYPHPSQTNGTDNTKFQMMISARRLEPSRAGEVQRATILGVGSCTGQRSLRPQPARFKISVRASSLLLTERYDALTSQWTFQRSGLETLPEVRTSCPAGRLEALHLTNNRFVSGTMILHSFSSLITMPSFLSLLIDYWNIWLPLNQLLYM